MSDTIDTTEQIIEDDPIAVRRAKREALMAAGKDPYGHAFAYSHHLADLAEQYADLEDGASTEDEVKVAGREIVGFPALHDDGASVSLRPFDTPEEAVAAFEHAEARYADRIQHIKSAPGYHGPKLPQDYSFKVCFTGFSKADKAWLTELAESAGMKVVTGVSASLDFLCCGDNAACKGIARAGI